MNAELRRPEEDLIMAYGEDLYREIELEERMVALGRNQIRKQIAKAREKGNESGTRYGKTLVAMSVEKIAGAIEGFLEKAAQPGSGKRHLAVRYVKRRIFLMRKKSKIGKLPDGVDIAIVTGLAALGREDEGQRLEAFLTKAAGFLSNPALTGTFDTDKVLERLAARKLKTTPLLRSTRSRHRSVVTRRFPASVSSSSPNTPKRRRSPTTKR
ncbi:hypothetical protein [uncultured Tateyamaria sp.]|uniref:hypothetical protein n=1 Tax=uncultured Tateyamaria sp. TaxID=455651 RepID=UPI002628388A|nr:hypothetical protein [uncultured Tateyamaria sp.]